MHLICAAGAVVWVCVLFATLAQVSAEGGAHGMLYNFSVHSIIVVKENH